MHISTVGQQLNVCLLYLKKKHDYIFLPMFYSQNVDTRQNAGILSTTYLLCLVVVVLIET